MSEVRGKTLEKNCQHCGAVMTVRVADHKRGWGSFCSKSCKAKDQERHNGPFQLTKAYRAGKRRNQAARRKHDPRKDGIWRHGNRVKCSVCGDWATNGVVSSFLADTPIDPVRGVPIEWYCDLHMCDTHPLSDDAL